METEAPVTKARRAKQFSPLDYTHHPLVKLFVSFNLLFLYFPLLALVAFSFNDTARNIVWRGFTFGNYADAFNDSHLIEAFRNSLTIAGTATAVSVVIGTALGLALHRFRFPLKNGFEAWMYLPIMIPEVCMGVAMLAFFDLLRIPLGLFTIIVSHVAFCMPFVAVVVRARAAGSDPALEEASADLGASQWQTFWYVTIPELLPGIIAGALLAFTVSLDDFVITFFTAGPGSTTFPVQVYSMIKFSVTPEINVAASVLMAITLSLIAVVLLIESRTSSKRRI